MLGVKNKGIHSVCTRFFFSNRTLEEAGKGRLGFYVAPLAEPPEIGKSTSSYSAMVIIVRRAVSRAAVSIIFLYGYCDRYHCLVDRILPEYGYDPIHCSRGNIKVRICLFLCEEAVTRLAFLPLLAHQQSDSSLRYIAKFRSILCGGQV